MELQLKEATLEQVNHYSYILFKIHNNFKPNHFDYQDLSISEFEFYKNRGYEHYCLYLGEKVIGYISAEVLADNSFIRIRRIFIEEEFRRNKYATTMVIDFLHEKGKFENIDVYTEIYLLDGYKLFRNMGFEIYDIGRNGKLYMKQEL